MSIDNLFCLSKTLQHYQFDIESVIKEVNSSANYSEFFYRRINYEKFMNAYGKDLLLLKHDQAEGRIMALLKDRKTLINIYSISNSKIELSVTSPYWFIIEELEALVEPEPEKETIHNVPHIFMLVSRRGTLHLSEFLLKENDVQIHTHYNDDLLPTHEKIIDKIQNGNSGLVLLHGEPGTGKTVYLKHLTSLLPEQRFIFFPREYVKLIASPEFLEFAVERLGNSVLIMEDAEELLLDRTEFQNNIVPAILNITDGMLSDLLNIKMICTFNCKEEHIDSALLRKGRLIAKHKFDKLCYEKAKILAHTQNKQIPEGKPITLAEIYGD